MSISAVDGICKGGEPEGDRATECPDFYILYTIHEIKIKYFNLHIA